MGKNLVIYKNDLYERVDGSSIILTSPCSWIKKEPKHEKNINLNEIINIDSNLQLFLWFCIKYISIIGIFLNIAAICVNYISRCK